MSEALKFTGLDEAIIGEAQVWVDKGRERRLVYSGDRLVIMLRRDHDMSAEEALEYIDFNIEGAYVGPNTPVVCWARDETKERVRDILAHEVLGGRIGG